MRDPSKFDIRLGDDGQTFQVDPIEFVRTRRRKLIASNRDFLADQHGGLIAVFTPIQTGDELRVKKSKNRAVMAHVSQKSFYDIAFEKLGERSDGT